ncbi:hypothetical protein WN943_019868 [Citrus x changshan-huyou]
MEKLKILRKKLVAFVMVCSCLLTEIEFKQVLKKTGKESKEPCYQSSRRYCTKISIWVDKVEVAKIKMTMVEDWKVFGEVKIGFDEMKHAILKFIASHTNSTFMQSYGKFSYQHSHSICKLYKHQNILLI